MNLKDKVVVVTGAGGTLCSEMAISLAGKGAKVALLGRTKEKLIAVEETIKKAGGTASSVSCDVISEASVQAAREEVTKQFGDCSILINGAGGNQAAAITTLTEFDPKELEDKELKGFFNLSMNDFHSVVNTNTMGTVIPSFVFGRDMAKNGGGSIINFASMTSYQPLSRVAAYAIAKAGMVNFTMWLSAYLAPANIRVNAIAPGFFLNDRSRKILLTEDGYSERGQKILDHTPMKRFGEAKELIGCMNWLIDDEASGFVTGITVPIDGGFLATPGM